MTISSELNFNYQNQTDLVKQYELREAFSWQSEAPRLKGWLDVQRCSSASDFRGLMLEDGGFGGEMIFEVRRPPVNVR